MQLKLSGHDSFHCRPYWLKKGFDFIQEGNKFSDKAGIELGVGRNMVNSIRFWLKAFDLVDENDELTSLAEKIFSDDGWDPYLEDEATLWLLHYKLCAVQYSSIYSLIFSELRKVRPEFSKTHFSSFINEIDTNQSSKVVDTDFAVFTRTYGSNKSKNDVEDSYSGLFSELNLLTEVKKNEEKNMVYHIQNSRYYSIPWQIILFCILDNPNNGLSVSMNDLFNGNTALGNIFALNRDQMDQKLVEIADNITGITYTNDAGLKVLQFKERMSAMSILENYYEG